MDSEQVKEAPIEVYKKKSLSPLRDKTKTSQSPKRGEIEP